uniref:Uncharacterized protein n=1 Tax=Acrobeloides nanus TaxID=290746 RepID=A0A914E6J5_9BILA
MTEIEVKQGLKTKNGQEAPAPELSQKIIEQVEYYFGDINLPRDKFLQDEIKKGDGWVALETMLKFNRLKQLTKDTYQISNALQDSLLIQVSGDMKKIRRSPEILLPEDWLEYCREIKTRTVYVKGFPVDTKLDEILGFVKPHGTVEKIVMRHVKGRPTFRGSVFVTFADKEAAQRFLNNDRVKEYNGQELLKLMQTDYWARKKLETISKKMEKKQTLPKSKTKNDRLKSRPDLQDYKENLFFTSKTISDVYVSPSVFAKWPIRSVVNKNLQELKKIINDKRFPIDGLNYGFSHYDQRRPEMLALLSGDKKLYDEYMKLNKALNSERDERLQRPTTEECLLRKMATGRTNYQQLDPATAKIERTRGGREGNNALINYDCRYNNMAPDKSVQLILESNPSFDMLDHAANHKDSSVIRRHELAGQIHYAVRCGHRKLAGSMIKAYAEHEFDQLHIKSLLNDKEGLGKFVPMDASKKSANHKNITPIHMAAINPSAKFLNTLIPLQSNFNDPDTDNWHTIHYAAVCEGPSPLKHLLDLNTPIILQTNRNETPLHCAARTGRVENLKLLVAALRKLKDADTNKDTTNYDDEDGEPKSKRSKYSKYQKTDIVTVQLNAKDLAGFTPLHMAVENGHIDVVKFLLSQPEINVEVQTGAAKNKKLGRGQRCLGGNNAGTKKITPLILACQKGNIEMVEVLINEGKAYIDQPDRFKRTPLSHAIIGGHFHIVNLLLKLGASLSKKPDSSGNSAAHYAAAYGWLDILNLLVQIEPDILNQPNDWHLTPLPIAYLKGHLGIVEHVLNGEYAEKIDINAVDNDGCTLLMLIIKNRDIIGPSKSIKDQVEYLISKGADASKVDSFSNSTLHYFASLNVKLKATHPDDFNPQNKTHTFENKLRLTFKEYEQTIDYLLNAGAKLDVKNDKNSIPVDLALRTGNLILTRYLFEKDPKLSLDFWKSIELECENRRTNVLHLLVDLPFKVHAEVNVWSGVYGPMEEQYDVIPILKNIIDKVDQKTLIGMKVDNNPTPSL